LAEEFAVRLGQQRGPAAAVVVRQDRGIAVAEVGGHPVVDGPPGYAQTPRHRGDGFPRGDFQDGQGTAVEAGVVGGLELLFQTAPLPEGQAQGVHGWPSLTLRLPIAPSV